MQEEESLDEEKLTALVTEAMENAGKVFQESRRIEGGGLCEDLLGKLKKVSALVEQIKDRSPEIVEELRKMGHEVRVMSDYTSFGRGEIIWRCADGVLAGATEPRADGTVAAW